jgi:hypothetical protein
MAEQDQLDDKHPFGKFTKPILAENTPNRGYATTGSPIQEEEAQAEKETIERVEFDYDSAFETMHNKEEDDDDDDDSGEVTQTQHNAGLDDDEVKLNKKVQAKIAKSQSQNIVGFYVMILRACWRWLGKYDEQKLNVMHIRGEIDIHKTINNHPLIYHIKQLNAEVDEWEIDEDQQEAIQEALEIYMISKNIQTSPGMNLAMAMGVPAIEMLGRAIGQKRQINNLIASVSEMHQAEKKKQTILQRNAEAEQNSLRMQLEQEQARNKELMQSAEVVKKEPQPTTRTARKDKPSPAIDVAKKPAMQVSKEKYAKTDQNPKPNATEKSSK